MAQGSHQNEPNDNNYMNWLPKDISDKIWTPDLLAHVEQVEDAYEEWYYNVCYDDDFMLYDGEGDKEDKEDYDDWSKCEW